MSPNGELLVREYLAWLEEEGIDRADLDPKIGRFIHRIAAILDVKDGTSSEHIAWIAGARGVLSSLVDRCPNCYDGVCLLDGDSPCSSCLPIRRLISRRSPAVDAVRDVLLEAIDVTEGVRLEGEKLSSLARSVGCLIREFPGCAKRSHELRDNNRHL